MRPTGQDRRDCAKTATRTRFPMIGAGPVAYPQQAGQRRTGRERKNAGAVRPARTGVFHFTDKLPLLFGCLHFGVFNTVPPFGFGDTSAVACIQYMLDGDHSSFELAPSNWLAAAVRDCKCVVAPFTRAKTIIVTPTATMMAAATDLMKRGAVFLMQILPIVRPGCAATPVP